MEYTSKGVGTAALTTGIIGTSLGALSSAGGLAGILGIGAKGAASSDPADRPVTRYEMELYKQISERDNEIVLLKAEKSANARADALQAQISQNSAWAAGVTANMGFMAQQIGQLYTLTQLVVPNGNVAPGWGPAQVRPFPPFPPVNPPVSDTPATTTTTTGG